MNLQQIKSLVSNLKTKTILDEVDNLFYPTHLSIDSNSNVYLHRIDVPFRINVSRVANKKELVDNFIPVDIDTELKNIQVIL